MGVARNGIRKSKRSKKKSFRMFSTKQKGKHEVLLIYIHCMFVAYVQTVMMFIQFEYSNIWIELFAQGLSSYRMLFGKTLPLKIQLPILLTVFFFDGGPLEGVGLKEGALVLEACASSLLTLSLFNVVILLIANSNAVSKILILIWNKL